MNIQGIEILNKEPIYTGDMRIILGVILISLLILILCAFFCYDDSIFALIAIAVIGMCVILCLTVGQKETGRYRYEVTINDEVSFKELYEKYDVIEQKGKIYVIEEKEVEE